MTVEANYQGTSTRHDKLLLSWPKLPSKIGLCLKMPLTLLSFKLLCLVTMLWEASIQSLCCTESHGISAFKLVGGTYRKTVQRQ